MYVLKENNHDVIYLEKPSEEKLSSHQWFYLENLPKKDLNIFDYNNKKVHSYKEEHTKYCDAYQENKLLKAQLKAQTERSDFIEDCIAEMAGVVYNTEETT